MNPRRDTLAGRAYNDLRNLARRRDRDPVEYFTLYTLEGFLARLATSAYEKNFVLKGGLLMTAFESRRPKRDIDLNAAGLPNDIESVADRVAAIAATEGAAPEPVIYLDCPAGSPPRATPATAG